MVNFAVVDHQSKIRHRSRLAKVACLDVHRIETLAQTEQIFEAWRQG